MKSLNAFDLFVRVSETGSFTAAGQQLGISASAVSKAITRLEARLGVRLLHRSTRTMSLTSEGDQFLKRCRRILYEVAAAENELSQSNSIPQGKLRISLPSVALLFMPKLAQFNQKYSKIELEIDCTDRLVDIIEEGFDAVIRTGTPIDSRLISRKIGHYQHVIVAAPSYFEREGIPQTPEDLITHRCLLYRYRSTGKLADWPLGLAQPSHGTLPSSMITNSLEPLITFAEQGLGIASIPEIAIKQQLKEGRLISILDGFNDEIITLRVVWPSNRYLAPKLRVFVDFVVDNLLALS